MHKSFVEYFCDPKTREDLELEVTKMNGEFIESGSLKSKSNSYPIVRGIPRFVEYKAKNYSSSFGYQWKNWPRLQFDSENVGKPMEGHTTKMWEKITGIDTELSGQVVLDIGCGPGRFIDVAQRKGAKVIGIDYSEAVEVAKKNFKSNENVCICQGDALNLPFKDSVLDGAFTIGVLHHTPAPNKGVEQAWKCLGDKGWFGISVYERGGYYNFFTVHLWRRIFKLLLPIFGYYPPLIYAYFTIFAFWPIARSIPVLGKAVRIFFPFVNLPDVNWSILDTFDSVTPSYQSAHESFEVFTWLRKAGFKEVEPTDWGFTSYKGKKLI